MCISGNKNIKIEIFDRVNKVEFTNLFWLKKKHSNYLQLRNYKIEH